MGFSESVVTKWRRRKLGLGVWIVGSYVVCKYLALEAMSLADTKRKLVLKDKDVKIRVLHHLIKGSETAFLITTETDEKDRQIWNDKLEKAEEIG